MQISHSVSTDFPDLQLPPGLDIIAGLLYVPLSHGGKDFICFLRKGQIRDVHWAGKPYKEGGPTDTVLEPRKSFKVRIFSLISYFFALNLSSQVWSERVAGRCRTWTDEQMETAGVLALVYGKVSEFICLRDLRLLLYSVPRSLEAKRIRFADHATYKSPFVKRQS